MSMGEWGRRNFLRQAALAAAAVGGAGRTLEGATTAWSALAGTGRVRVPRRALGSTGETVPILLMGGSQTFDSSYDKKLHRAFKQGVDYVDAALSYGQGRTHAAVATFLEQIRDRRKLWITSKSHAHSTSRIEADADLCLRQMRTDYVDLYFMHNLDDVTMLEPDFLAVGERLKKAKKIRFFGFSCHGRNVVAVMNKAAKVGSGAIDAIMFRYNFEQYGDAELSRAVDACKRAGIGLIAMKVQRSVPGEAEKVVRFRSKNFSLAQAKLKAVWADERIDAAVSEMTNVQEVRENVAAAVSSATLSSHEWRQLEELGRRTAHLSCRGCSQICEPLAGGDVRIADSLRYLMYHEAYAEPERASRLFNTLPSAARSFTGVDFSRATAACPQGIPIAERLERAAELLSRRA